MVGTAGASTLTAGPSETYTTIGAAVANAGDGDTIIVKPGTYEETVDLSNKNNITIMSESGNPADTCVKGSFLVRDLENVTVTGFNISNSTPSNVTQPSNISLFVPPDAVDIYVYNEIKVENTSAIESVDSYQNQSRTPIEYVLINHNASLATELNGNNSAIQGTARINEPVRWTILADDIIVKFKTPAPYMIEKIINRTIKEVTVESDASVHYHNVTVFTNIAEVGMGDIKLIWLDEINGTKLNVTANPAYNLTYIDTDCDGLIERIEWTVPRLPRLSEQTFEVVTDTMDITVIDVQSYPVIGGNWTVRFNTTGTADLTVTPINGTSFGENIEFLGLWDGTEWVDAIYNGTSVFYPNWNFSSGKIVNKVLKAGKHTLEFRFGDALDYAYNGAGSDQNITDITFVYGPGQQTVVTETGEAVEGVNLTINATIHNDGVAESGSFYVLFYDGDSEFYNVSVSNIPPDGSANATGYWTTLPGTHNITVKADPQNTTDDADLSNNNASRSINVSAWQKYYGSISGSIVLASSASDKLDTWDWSNTNEEDLGYVYIVKNGASINWSALWALGYRKDSTTKGTADFADADDALNLQSSDNNATGFNNNNITSLFSSDGTNAITTLDSVVVHGKTIDGVPVVNSTDMTNTVNVTGADCVTGILWDTSDAAGDEYTGAEDLVFIANIRHVNTGLVSTYHDYEIAVPCNINEITGGDVDFYTELT